MKIKEIRENKIIATLDTQYQQSIINHYVFIRDSRIFVGEITELIGNDIVINLLGEIINNNFIFGINSKPSSIATIDFISHDVTAKIISFNNDVNGLLLGYNPIYEDIPICLNLSTFFNSHFTILGGTGSGKSHALSKIVQTVFEPKEYIPYNASLFVFDTYGEYYPSFLNIEQTNPDIAFKAITTNPDSDNELLTIPPYLLSVDDLAILLNADSSNQIQVLEKALELVNIFKREENDITSIKNDIIARAIIDILLSGRPSVQIRDQVFSILSFYNTKELSLESELVQPGYTRTLKNCLIVDNDGKIREMELLTKYFSSFLLEKDNSIIPKGHIQYTLEDLENAIDFALISEGILKSEKIFDTNNLLKVRIHNLIESDNKKYFEYPTYIDKIDYINSLITKNNRKAQLINFNINYVDDRLAKTIVKIITNMLFDYTKSSNPRGSKPVHIILEEAHRYVQNDNDVKLLGYNIFERIAKEGRKYGILLGLITQRPSELSETVMSQCNNFLVFKMTHPKDMEYIKKLIPYMDDNVSKRVQTLPPGNCYCFGPAFRIPMIVKLGMPNPTPLSNNVNILKTWFIKK